VYAVFFAQTVHSQLARTWQQAAGDCRSQMQVHLLQLLATVPSEQRIITRYLLQSAARLVLLQVISAPQDGDDGAADALLQQLIQQLIGGRSNMFFLYQALVEEYGLLVAAGDQQQHVAV